MAVASGDAERDAVQPSLHAGFVSEVRASAVKDEEDLLDNVFDVTRGYAQSADQSPGCAKMCSVRIDNPRGCRVTALAWLSPHNR